MTDRTRPPHPGLPRPFEFPRVERRRLASGLEVVAARLERFPLLYMGLVSPAGAIYEPPGEAGLASLTGELLDEGTEDRNSLEIAATIERLGGAFTTGADWDSGYLSFLLLSDHWRSGLGVLTEIANRPVFPEQQLERLRREALADLLRRHDRPSLLADDHLSRVLYGDGPYATPLPGTQESLGLLTRERVLEFYRRHYVPAGSSLVLAGDFDLDELAPLAEELLAQQEGPATPLPPLTPPPRDQRTVHLVDRPGATQTELRIGQVGIPRGHPEYTPLVVLNVILGGSFTSRINLNLRERHGYTYGANSRLRARLAAGPFYVGTAVASDVAGAAAREILVEIDRIRAEPVSSEELDHTRAYLTGVFPYTLQTVGGLAQRLETLAVHGLPDDYYDRYPERIAGVTTGQLLDVARRHLEPSRMAVVAVGPAETLRPQLAELGPVEIVERA